MMYNGRPLTRKQTIRMLIAMTILAWATTTLLHQWGYGAEVPTTESREKFVPSSAYGGRGVTLEIRSDATVIGGEVKLRQVCRWADRDKAVLEPIGDLVLARLGQGLPFKAISADEIRGILRDAGINIATINFAGAISCTVNRSDVEYDEGQALLKWIEARENAKNPTAVLASAPTTQASDENPVKTLRDLLINDLATRLNISPDVLQVDFKPQDQKVLATSTPLFQFQIEPLKARSLGTVMWNVSIGGSSMDKRKMTITAEARAWQEQLVVSKPLTARQIIRAEDVISRRALVDQLTDDSLLSADQTIGQQASRDLKPGTVMTGKMIDPVQLVKTGQFVTVTLEQGLVRIRSVARALEGGVYGQTIRVKNEATREIFQVVIVGPQTATMNLSSPVASAAQN